MCLLDIPVSSFVDCLFNLHIFEFSIGLRRILRIL